MRLPGLRFPRRVAGFLMIHCLLSWTSTAAWAQFETRARDSFPEGAYSIALGDFTHVVAGGAETFLLVFAGQTGIGHALGGTIVPAPIGAIIGGTGLFSLLAHAQVRQEL